MSTPANGRRESKRSRLPVDTDPQPTQRRTVRLADADEAGPSSQPQAAAPGGPGVDKAELQPWESAKEFYQKQATDTSSTVSEQESQRLIREVVRFMLLHQYAKPDVPVKRQELNNLIMPSYKGSKHRNLAGQIIPHAQLELVMTFGLEMKEIKTVAAGVAKAAEDGAKMYVLRSLLPASLRDAFVEPPGVANNRAFAMTVLGLLSIARHKLSEEDLWTHLEELGIKPKEQHPVFGRPEDELAAMLQKRYILYKKDKTNDGPQGMYYTGDNALDELGSKRVLNDFVEEMFTKPVQRPAGDEEEDMVELDES